MRFNHVQDWLDWQVSLHPQKIELGLDRIRRVASELSINLTCPVMTVAGTNGKGSTVAFLQSILLASGQRVACYTSPHIHRYHERISINGELVTDEQLLTAFSIVDQARGDTTLSFFEFGTLTALWLFMQQPLDVVVLEVGLGGRLDAVNIIDADIAVITHLALDHMDWLGNDLDQIAREKAGIARAHIPVICADPEAPQSLLGAVNEAEAICFLAGRDYSYEIHPDDWDWWMQEIKFEQLPYPPLRGEHQLQNAAGALAALIQLDLAQRPTIRAIRTGLQTVQLAGRWEKIRTHPDVIFDVAHNPDSVKRLAELLKAEPVKGRTVLVIGVMQDKNVLGMVDILMPLVDHWYVSAAQIDRAYPQEELGQLLLVNFPDMQMTVTRDLETAFKSAQASLNDMDRLIVTGSFYTVAEVRALLL